MNLDINDVLQLMYYPLMLALHIIIGFCMLRGLKRMFDYVSYSSSNHSNRKNDYSPKVNLNKNSNSKSNSSVSKTSSNSNTDYLLNTALITSSSYDYDSSSSSSCGSSSSYDSSSSSSYDSSSSCDSGGW